MLLKVDEVGNGYRCFETPNLQSKINLCCMDNQIIPGHDTGNLQVTIPQCSTRSENIAPEGLDPRFGK